MSNARRFSIPVKSFTVKLHNRRVVGGVLADGTYVWRFRSLNQNRAIHGDSIRLSGEAVEAMFAIYMELLRKEDAR